jgi:hypothetical protein
VLIAYIAASWLLIQVSETLLPVYGFGDAAFAELDKAIENGEPPIPFDFPVFWGLFDDPRWDELMAKSGMPREKIEAIDFDVVLPDK